MTSEPVVQQRSLMRLCPTFILFYLIIETVFHRAHLLFNNLNFLFLFTKKGCSWVPDHENVALPLHLVLSLMSQGPVGTHYTALYIVYIYSVIPLTTVAAENPFNHIIGISDAIGWTNVDLLKRQFIYYNLS